MSCVVRGESMRIACNKGAHVIVYARGAGLLRPHLLGDAEAASGLIESRMRFDSGGLG
jgi:hypothetical protein